MNYSKEEIGKTIKSYRNQNALTQEQLANKLGTNIEQIMRWERGKNLPNKFSLMVLIEKKILPPPTK